MSKPQHRICRLADEAAAMSEPENTLRKLRELRGELIEFERSRVAEALRSGSSFGSVAKAMGISRQAAHRRYRDLAPASAELLPLSAHSRHAVRLAGDEAAAEGARYAGSEHLLLGVLRSGVTASRALEAEGITVEATRACLSAGEGERAPHAGNAGAKRAILAEAAAIARARHAPCVEPDHIVLAAISDPDSGAMQALTALGVTPASVRERLGCSVDDAQAVRPVRPARPALR